MSKKTNFRIPPKSSFRGLRLDPEIVDLIIELNKAGFITYGSCAGHPSYSGKGMMRGYISFEGYNGKEGIMKILKAHGLRNIRIEHRMDASDNYRGEATLVSFDAIGTPKWSGDYIIDQLDAERQLPLFKGVSMDIPDVLRLPKLQCVTCWHRWQPAEWFKNTFKCPVCQSTWLIKVEDINVA